MNYGIDRNQICHFNFDDLHNFLGAWKAIREEFPNSLVKGCAFHFGQAVWRKVQELGLRTTYSKRGPEYRYIRSLMALPFLPSADIQPAFDRLAVRATSEELQQLVAYMDTNWIGSAVWQPRNWSIFQTNIRTNNDVEGNLNHIYLKKID